MNTNIKFPESLVEYKVTTKQVIKATMSTFITMLLILFCVTTDLPSTSIIYIMAIIMSFCAVVITALSFIFLRECIHIPTDKVLQNRSIEFDMSEFNEIDKMVNGKELAKLLKSNFEGKGMILELVYSKDMSLVICQYFKYVPYTYQPFSELKEIICVR